MADEHPARGDWTPDDLVQRRPDPEVTWPSAEERADAAARAEQRRQEMAGHADPGWMMFPSIADDGRVLPRPHDDHEHGPGHPQDGESEEQHGADGDHDDGTAPPA